MSERPRHEYWMSRNGPGCSSIIALAGGGTKRSATTAAPLMRIEASSAHATQRTTNLSAEERRLLATDSSGGWFAELARESNRHPRDRKHPDAQHDP